MRRDALPLLFLAACATAPDTGERLGAARAQFTSAEAVLLDFELEGTLVSDAGDLAALRAQIQAQLMFTVGQLNGERSVGRFERLSLWDINARPFTIPQPLPEDAGAPTGGEDAGAPDAADADADTDADAGPIEPPPPPPPPPPPIVRYAVTYHARLPVAWGGQGLPASYELILPASVEPSDLASFVGRYGEACADPEGGNMDVGRMFLFFRPRQAGCQLADGDVTRSWATVTRSSENALGKYPEYHRVWADHALEAVVMFTRGKATEEPSDLGAWAHDAFVALARGYLAELQPIAARRTEQIEAGQSKLSAELRDGRRVEIATRLVGYDVSSDGPAFDAWYEAVTPAADIIIANGHAGLGQNVRALMAKGSFRPGQYLIWFANGCDTLAYVDRTLADRRALLNPDDPGGTRYLDTVTNAMASYFRTLPAVSMTFVRALGDARRDPPKRYDEIFAGFDPAQVTVVTGEEDNELAPIPPPPLTGEKFPFVPAPAASAAPAPPSEAEQEPPPDQAQEAPPVEPARRSSCDASAGGPHAGSGLLPLCLLVAALVARRRRTG